MHGERIDDGVECRDVIGAVLVGDLQVQDDRAVVEAITGFAFAVISWWALSMYAASGVTREVWALAIVQGSCMFLFVLNSAHDATHDALNLG